MTSAELLTQEDLDQLSVVGIPPSEINRQLDLFRRPPEPAALIRPCRPGDGITRLSEDEQSLYADLWHSLAETRRLAKFVPASGAASRMFKDLNAEDQAHHFLKSLPRFAFRGALEDHLSQTGKSLDSMVEGNDSRSVLRLLLDEAGLGYRQRAKGLILFHDYPDRPRTALEDHLWEGIGFLSQVGGHCRFHFTVTADHLEAFRELIDRVGQGVERQFDVTFEVDFSTQSPATDTIAVDLDNRPCRRSDGTLLLRPAGHGALLGNLQRVDADVVFIKNIDNVAHQRLHPFSIHWKRILAGYFAALQDKIFEILARLDSSDDTAGVVNDAQQLVRSKLATEVPQEIFSRPEQAQKDYFERLLDRPLRVCGMVKNEGEPGGGPFWLRDDEGRISGQIIEQAQVDLESPDQADRWRSSTHFNPNDLVCGLRDRHGGDYPLADFVDPSTAFVAQKDHQGRPLKALERPGLWNGSMARWNTAFVEVPLATFTPVKTVFDLLRPEHQP